MSWRHREVARFEQMSAAQELARELASEGIPTRVRTHHHGRPYLTPLQRGDLVQQLREPNAWFGVEVPRRDYSRALQMIGGGASRGGGISFSPLLWQVVLLLVLLSLLGVWWMVNS
jgi:hypothetical protein